MKSLPLETTVRKDIGSKFSNALRSQGQIPCVMYGGEKNIHFSVKENDIKKFIHTPDVYLAELKIGEKKYVSKIQDVQFHPVKDTILHVDFYETSEDKSIKMAVPLRLTGLSVGVQQGGSLIQKQRRVNVVGKIEDLPDFIEIDVSALDIGSNVRIEDVPSDKYSFSDTPKKVLAQVKFTRAAMSAAGDGGTETENAEGEEEKTETTKE